MVKAHDMATLQKLLKWLHWKDKCWCSLIAKESMLHNKNKQQQQNFVKKKKISWHIWKKKKKNHQQRKGALILISNLSKKEKEG